MSREQDPLVIIGGGCAGLSLATHLCDAGVYQPIVIVEPRRLDDYFNDRTWCGFYTRHHRFGHLAKSRWSNWRFVTDRAEASHQSETSHYQQIAAGDFYADCLARLSKDSRVELLLGHSVLTVRGKDVETIDREGRTRCLAAGHIFDSRPPTGTEVIGGPDDTLLWQQFVGLEVETDHDDFDPAGVTMMDFRTPQRGEIHFVYVLPTTRRTALVEATGFLARPGDYDTLHDDAARYVRDILGIESWRVSRREQGMIAMTTARIPGRDALAAANPHVTSIGLGGGAAKPSTGYAFAAIQEHSEKLALAVVQNRSPRSMVPGRAVSRWLDQIFLAYLARHPSRAPELFLRIAAGTKPDRFARFMMNHGTLLDDLAVVASMPKTPFILQALRSHRVLLYPRARRTPGVMPIEKAAGVGSAATADDYRRVHTLVALPLIALLCAGLWIVGPIPLGWQLALLGVGVASLGMPHGAMDHRVAEMCIKPRLGALGSQWGRLFVVGYLGLAAIVLLGWATIPLVTLVAFLLYSAVHFGLGDNGQGSVAAAVARGAVPIVLPLAIQPLESGSLLSAVAGQSVDLVPLQGVLITAAILCVLVTLVRAVGYNTPRQAALIACEVLLLIVANFAAPPLIAFGLYFVLLHASRHMIDLADWLAPGDVRRGLKRIGRECWPLTLMTLAAMSVALVFIRRDSMETSVVRVLFVTLSALTVPHMIVTSLAARR